MSLSLQCPACEEESPVEAFTTDAEEVLLSCTQCGAAVQVAANGEARVLSEPSNEGESDETRDGTHELICPKCRTAQARSSSCRVCGLLTELMADYRATSQDHEELDALWDEVAGNFDDDDAHERFLARIVALEEFSYAARRYRARADEGDDRARGYLDRVSRMAQALLATRQPGTLPEEGAEPFRGVALVLVFLLLTAGAIGFYAMLKWPR